MSKIAANLERNQAGEQFKMLDPARVPERPYSPDLIRINFFGIAAGLALGVMLVGLVEYRDASFTYQEDVARVLQLPVLALVPRMMSLTERRARTRRRLLALVGTGALIAGSVAVVVWITGIS